MTALTAPRDPVPIVRAERADRALLGTAIGIALALHGLALLLPLPERAAARPVVVRPDPPTWIRLPPPRPPEPPAVRAAPPADRRLPVPLPPEAQPEIEPLVEPPIQPIAATIDPDLAQPFVRPTAPPASPASAVYPEETAGLVRPQPLGERRRPDYPEIARRAGVGGQVVLRAVIDERGEVVDVEVVGAPRPDLGFADAAIEAVSHWHYRPGTIGGRPVPVSMTVVVDFDVR